MVPRPRPPLPSARRAAARRLRRTVDRLRGTLANHVETVVVPTRALAFWAAITLPFLNVALLVDGLSGTAEMTAFLALLGANVLALYVGQPYRR